MSRRDHPSSVATPSAAHLQIREFVAPMKRSQRVFVGAISFVLVASSSLGSAGAAINPNGGDLGGSGSTPTTSPKTTGPQGDYAVQAYAQEKGVSHAVAAERLVDLGRLTAYANERRRGRDFSAFRVVDTPSGPEGQLASTTVAGESFDETNSVRLFPARIPEAEFPQLSAALVEKARASGIADVSSVTIDPFTGDLTVWKRVGAQGPGIDTPELMRELRQVEPRLREASKVTVRSEPTSRPVMGGQKAVRNTSFLWFWSQQVAECTTAFGLYWAGGPASGYLTAGHCEGNSGWSVNGNSVTTYYDRTVGGYKDRVVLRANGASWWVWNGQRYEDMAAWATHIYNGAFYCMLSRRQYGQQCGSITAVNVSITGPEGQVWASRGSTNQKGIRGDSGGPVWQPYAGAGSESVPAGTVEAADFNGDRAYFLALDDQLAGTGWVLL